MYSMVAVVVKHEIRHNMYVRQLLLTATRRCCPASIRSTLATPGKCVSGNIECESGQGQPHQHNQNQVIAAIVPDK